nr:MAG TPA: zinc-ribbon domain protein [Caudoviricetes sp.]
MPEEYISREAALKDFEASNAHNPNWTPQRVKTLLLRQRTADAAEVVHGEWLRSDDDWNSLTTIQCSICGEEWCFETDDDVSLLDYKYCPNCGAKMDGAAK